MAICDPNTCSTDLPDKNTQCVPVRRQGGINYFGFRDCGETFDYTDATAWTAAIAAQKAWVVPVIAELPEPSDSKVQTIPCEGEELTGRTWMINAKDYDLTGTLDDGPPVVFTDDTAIFWNDVQAKARGLEFFFSTCEGKTYGPYRATITPGLVIPTTSKELQHVPVKVEWLSKQIPTAFALDLGTV